MILRPKVFALCRQLQLQGLTIVLDIAIINLTIVLPDPEAERMQIMVGLGTSLDPIIDAVLIQT